MASRMMAMVMMPPAGMPAAPTLEAVAVTLENGNETLIVGSNRKAKESFYHPLDSQDGEDLSSVQLCVVELSDEDCSDALENGCPVHVDRGTNGKDKAADAFVHTIILLNTLYHRGKSR